MAVSHSVLIQENSTGRTAAALVAVSLARVFVPLYFFLGAYLKIISGSPTHLPAALIQWTGAIGIDLLFVFRLSIAGELLVVGVMILTPRLARLAGLVLLGLFLPVLIGDLLLGASSCGCFGAVPVSPWVTLVIDAVFFLGLWLLGRGVESLRLSKTLPTWQVILAGLWAVMSFVIGFSIAGGFWAGGGIEPGTVAGGARPLPAEGFYMPVYDEWIGTSWSDIPIAQWAIGDVASTGTGTEYVMFFRKDCEHCHELMEAWFAGELPAPTLAVAVPEKTGFPETGVMSFSCPDCRMSELPTGIDWFLQTPVLMRLENGVVACASEATAENPVCLKF